MSHIAIIEAKPSPHVCMYRMAREKVAPLTGKDSCPGLSSNKCGHVITVTPTGSWDAQGLAPFYIKKITFKL